MTCYLIGIGTARKASSGKEDKLFSVLRTVWKWGEDFFQVCCQWDLEGMVSKRNDREYVSDRRRSS
jgi:ATP-dependent DNA ligase